MSYPRRATNKKIPFGTIFIILLAVAVVVAGAGITAYVLITKETPNNISTLCPSTGPHGHTILLVDKSDPMSFTQRKDFEVMYEEILTHLIPQGHLFSVYALADDFKTSAQPLLELCNPGDGREASRLDSNPVQLKRRFEQQYVKPMIGLRDELITSKSGVTSPILEMIQLTAITGFRARAVNGDRRLIIVSDMLHNTPPFSMYKTIPKHDAFVETVYGRKSIADLNRVKVEIRMLLNSPNLQNEMLLNFWKQHIERSGGTLVQYEPIKG